MVDKLRNRFYYNSKGKRNPDSNYVDCQEEERGGIIPDFQDLGEWRYISTKLNNQPISGHLERKEEIGPE